jgi:tripartite-type tricarboxylate transporter receptor subunit TctC
MLVWNTALHLFTTLFAISERVVPTVKSKGRIMNCPGMARRTIKFCLPILLVAAMLVPAGAQRLSNRPITIVVPYSPGTGPDVMARIVGEELQKRWAQAVVIDNKPGATGNIGTQFVARAIPDGHTLLMTSNPFTTNTSLLSNVPYDPIKSFVPIIDVGAGALALCVNPSVPATDVREFIAYARCTVAS